MKKIKLTQEQYAVIDDEDLEKVNKYMWQAYRPTGHKGFSATRAVQISMADVIMERHLEPGECAFHKNGNKLDNRKSNLGIRKRNKRSKQTSKHKGVSLDKRSGRWRSQFVLKGKCISLGYFDDEIDAANAYESAKLGQFSQGNPNDEYPVIE